MVDQNHNGYEYGYIVLQCNIVQCWYNILGKGIGPGYNNNKLIKCYVNIYTVVLFGGTCVVKIINGL